MTNAERIVLRFPNDTVADISGDPEVIRQILNRLDGVEISFQVKSGFYQAESTKDD